MYTISRKRPGRQVIISLCCVVIVLIIETYFALRLYETKISDPQPQRKASFYTAGKLIIFPLSFLTLKKEAKLYYNKYFNSKLTARDSIIVNVPENPIIPDLEFKHHTFDIYETKGEVLRSRENSHEKTQDKMKCELIFRTIDVKVSEAENRNCDLRKILRQFVNSNSTYYRELEQLIPDLTLQLDDDTIAEHWFQLIGSSVWLREYGVHLLTSRIVYSKTGDKDRPVVSLTYVQIFDQHWQELENAELIVPVVEQKEKRKILRKQSKSITYKIMLYPSFAFVPIYYNTKRHRPVFYGSEDPRLILVKNSLGFEEPIINYNLFHKTIARIKKPNDKSETKATGEINFEEVEVAEFYRSMYLGWLWRTQTGKGNVDPTDTKNKEHQYIKTKELMLPNGKRTKTEKNWSPFISYTDRLHSGQDEHIYFIYQYKDLRILKCSFESDLCEWTFQLTDSPNISQLRGGTQFMSITQFLDENLENNYSSMRKIKKSIWANFSKQLAKSQVDEVWIGVPRTALRRCGCGEKLYRPHIVTLARVKNTFALTQVSSSTDFDIDVLSWSGDADHKCVGNNLILPNGISHWQVDYDGSIAQEDVLTLSFSRADITVDIIYIRGVLKNILPLLTEVVKNWKHKAEFSNQLIYCAIEGAFEYCRKYKENVYSDWKSKAPEKL